MKELDLLKKDWNKNSNTFEQISESEIYKMIHRKSSSIVKWIFIISIIEFVFWTGVYIYKNDAQHHVQLQKYGVAELEFWINVFNYIVLIVFIYLFYKNIYNYECRKKHPCPFRIVPLGGGRFENRDRHEQDIPMQIICGAYCK